MPKPLDVLLVEDREDDEILITRALHRAGYTPAVHRVDNEDDMRLALSSGQNWDIVLSDYMLPCFDCPRALEVLAESGLDIPLIALSGTVSEDLILELLRAGARDYVMKDNLARLPSAVERTVNEADGRRQRKKLQSQLLQSQKMDAIGRLAGGVAHDFNNLLTVITGFAQLALLDENPARVGLEQILQAAERAAGLTRQLLAFSRQQTLEPRIFDVNKLVGDIDKMLRRLIGEDIDVQTRLHPLPLTVKADPGQIEQVLFNLVVNSRDAMPAGGKMIVSTGERSVDASFAKLDGIESGHYCLMSVSDTGKGIPASVLPHIFEPFFTTKPAGQGTGLGLSTAYGIVQQSGGAIHAYSEAGVGTTMTIFLPMVSPSTSTKIDQVTEEPVPHGKEVVLVAEDDPDVLNMVSEALKLRGFSVLRAENGRKALDVLISPQGATVQVLITDVVMPVMSGPLLVEQAYPLFPGLKVLFMSGYTEDVIQHHGIESGNVAFIQKPFAPGNLVRKVRQLIDNNRMMTEADQLTR